MPGLFLITLDFQFKKFFKESLLFYFKISFLINLCPNFLIYSIYQNVDRKEFTFLIYTNKTLFSILSD